MIKELVTDNKFNDLMKAEDLEVCLDQYLNPSWRYCTPEELLRESLKHFKLTMDTRKGANNLQVPPFIARPGNIALYVSNRHTVCGKKQMMYFFLEQVITGKIIKVVSEYLFTVDRYGSVIPGIQDPNRNYEMTETPGLNANAETLLSILSGARK